MKKQTAIVNIPLIYIEQPTFKPSLPNQQIVIVKALPEIEDEETKQEEDVKQQADAIEVGEIEEEQDGLENTIENGMHQSFLSKSIEEKLSILTKLPESMPKPLCEIVTREQTYTCHILSHDQDFVYFELNDEKETIKLDKESILSITIIRL